MKTYENLRGKRVDVRGRQVRANKILFPSLLARLAFPSLVSLFLFELFLCPFPWCKLSGYAYPYLYPVFLYEWRRRERERKKRNERNKVEKSSRSWTIFELAERKKRDNAGIVCISIGGQLPPGRDVNRLQEPAGK